MTLPVSIRYVLESAISASLPSFAFVSLGLIGTFMCRRLLAIGYSLAMWNRSLGKRESLATEDAKTVEVPAELAVDAEILVFCLTDTVAVYGVVLNADGVVENAGLGQLLMDLFSAEPTATRKMAVELEACRNMCWVDVPVFSGTPGTENSSLTAMTDGHATGIERLRPVLSRLDQRPTRMGEVGAGQATRVYNQMVITCNALMVAEMMALMERAGVNASLVAPALADGFVDSKPLQILAPQMAKGRYGPVKWYARTPLRDLDTTIRLPRKQGTTTLMSGSVAQLIHLHGGRGYLERDPATLVEQYRTAVE